MRKLTISEFIQKANKVHSCKFDYSQSEYFNQSTKISIVCPFHGEFTQRPDHHLKGHGCKQCMGETISASRSLCPKTFFQKCAQVHNSLYDYSKSNVAKAKDIIEIICSVHGSFFQRGDHHQRGSGCPHCLARSKGEEQISNILTKCSVPFVRQKTFPDLRTKFNYYAFDFYLPDFNTAIEYDGVQHFEPIKFFGGESALAKRIENDKTKSNYCADYGIRLIRIKYDEAVEEALRINGIIS